MKEAGNLDADRIAARSWGDRTRKASRAAAVAVALATGLAGTGTAAEPENLVLIRHVHVWDGVSDGLDPDRGVLVRGRMVEAVGPDEELAARVLAGAEEGIRVLDGGGRVLMPGLSDAHRHLMLNLGPEELLEAPWAWPAARAVRAAHDILMMGFTAVRDMGGPVQGLKRAIDEGTVPGPRIYPSGAMISQTSGHGDLRPRSELSHHLTGGSADLFQLTGWFLLADGRPEVLRSARENLRQGACQLKMMAGGGVASSHDPLFTVQFTEDELKAGVEAAADWGTYVAVHAYNSRSILRALRAGVRSIEHGQLADDEAMRAIGESGAFLVPQAWWLDRDPATARHPDKLREVQRGVEQEMELARKYGVLLGFGTDVFGSLGTEREALKEFTARTRWFRPVEILRQATSLNARLFALCGPLNPYPEGEWGVVRAGSYADLLVYDGNPLDDIGIVTRPEETLLMIMKDGVLYRNRLEEIPEGKSL